MKMRFYTCVALLCFPLPLKAEPSCDENTVVISQKGAVIGAFSVEIADDAQERGQGLMYRSEMAQDHAMLFIYPKPQNARFWMKNTEIALDMLFADERGEVKHIHHNARPFDETVINGGDDIQFVLEVNAGLSEALALEEGAKLHAPSIEGCKTIP